MASSLQRAADMFPLSREIRLGPAYFYGRFRDDRITRLSINTLEKSIKSAPYEPDLWFNLAQLKQFSKDEVGAQAALAKARLYAPASAFLRAIQ